jgi:two-component system alkaline phosphatase synthesis response regulator PhoP
MSNEKILIIEDEKVLADVLESKLKKEGYQVEVAFDGESGYEKIGSWNPDLILLDIVMPKMNGYEVLEKMNTEGKKIPAIIISNSGQPVEIEKTTKLGAVDHLIKTQFDTSEVIVKVRNYLAGIKTDSAEKDIVNEKTKETDGGKYKVMLIEDDNFLRSICSQKLSKEGFEVIESVDGVQALKTMEKIKPNVILLDLVMPTMDGFEVLTKIRNNPDKEIAAIPVVILSNLGQDEEIKKALSLGANMFLVKANFTTGEIVKKVKKLLGMAE